MQERYGVDTPLKCPEILEKSKATSRERYGVDWYTQTDEFKQRAQETNMERYGAPSYAQTDEYLEHMKKTQSRAVWCRLVYANRRIQRKINRNQ